MHTYTAQPGGPEADVHVLSAVPGLGRRWAVRRRVGRGAPRVGTFRYNYRHDALEPGLSTAGARPAGGGRCLPSRRESRHRSSLSTIWGNILRLVQL